MPNVEARISAKGKHFEISVDLDEALKVRSEDPKASISSALQSNHIFTDLKKGNIASEADLKSFFNTTDVYEIATKIIKKGEVQKTQEFRDAEKDKRIKQVLDLILRNAVDQHGKPYTQERLKKAIEEIHFNFDSRSAEQQMPDLIHQLKKIIPIKIETRRIKLTIPAVYTGQAYGIIGEYKESEEWLSNGNLQVIVNIPAGSQIDFYEKLNHITHGAVQSQDLTPQE